jgi:soluble lytic murein transglycosylase-like protein
MLRPSRQLKILVVLFAVAAAAGSQEVHYTVPAASVVEDFSAYHQALSNAADAALANVARETAIKSRIAGVATNDTPELDATSLHDFARKYWNGNDEAVRRAVSRVTQLTPVLAPILQEEGIPEDIAALVLVESGGQPTASSPKGARGIWQFMPDTARHFGLTINSGTDDRLDVPKSTRAAAHYLRNLHDQFGDWSLALAAYNAGETVVQKAILRSGSKDFALLSSKRFIPAETRGYVPAVMAALHLFAPTHLLGSRPTQIRRSQEILVLRKFSLLPDHC